MGDFYASKDFRGWNKALERFRLQAKSEYRIRLEASIDVARLLLYHGLPFRGHGESEASTNQSYFLGFLRWHGDKHPDVEKVILEKAPQNDTLTCPIIQKDIVNACEKETLKVIIEDLNGDHFGILVDESKDISHNRTNGSCFEKEIYSLLSDHSLSPSKIRGQGYDGVSNMKGEINGLKTLIMKDSSSAYYSHCFAHQLQLTLVVIAKKHLEVEEFFDHVTNVLNVVGGSFKRRDLLRHHQAENLKQLLESGEAYTEQGLHQERGLQRPGDTRWGSHFKTLDNFLVIFSFIVHVFEVIEIEGSTPSDRNQAEYLLTKVKTILDVESVGHVK
ncbi:zinc finger MYM-type protein 1-like [Capsicum annuum]|uniref:zinc finger MYM-type protein 1-like n=1 Tax=Capsicum annuum TaxID=4072 RepID=UPI001FB0EAA7|nr:zinc finger MYM-type protein 1-like [Capsicum annuum]